MLEEPECGAPGARGEAAAMDYKDRPAFPVKKLIQARLPFKRLNLVPKEKTGGCSDDMKSSQNASLHNKVPDLEISLDTLENDCHMGSDVELRPKLVNGKGPLDNFLRSRVGTNIDETTVIIDLTEDSNDPLISTMDHHELNSEASPSREAASGVREDEHQRGVLEACQSSMAFPEETLLDIPCQTEESVGSGGTERSGGLQTGLQESFPALTGSQRTYSEPGWNGWSDAGGILVKGKVPLVVLQDILAAKPAQAKSLETKCIDKSVTSETEVLESCPEEDSVLSPSSLSTSSPNSSPEGPSAPQKQFSSVSPFPTSTPIRRITKKFAKGSTEKNETRLQREKERLGKQLKLQAEKEEKEKLKEEAKRAKEEAKKKKEEEKELKEKERREKREKDEKEKAEKQRLKEERRKERQEALEAKLEEKRKKEEEKRLKEEEKRIKAEKAEITRFFQKPKTPQAPKTLAGSCGKFAPFEIKEHMVLAPLCRAAFDQDLCDQLDQLLQQQSSSRLSFLEDLKGRRPLRSGPTLVCNQSADLSNSDVVIVESSKVDGVPERKTFGRMKLLQFSENHRPAYWGTWNKKTTAIRPRNPWTQDRKLLDYEVDSDEEWEEEEPGESLSHSEEDDDDEVGEDEDEDDGFFVPHGYLSEDEGVTEECADPENHKVRQKLKAKEWDEFLAKGKRFHVLQPVKIGCIWAAEKHSHASGDLKVLQQFSACLLAPVPSEEEPAPKASKREKDQQILAQLLPLLHGNVNGSKVIIREFQECCRQGLLRTDASSPEGGSASPPSPSASCPQTPTASEDTTVPSKARLKRIISENSVYEKRPDFRMCWYVHPQVLRSFEQEHLPVPCRWSYVTSPPSAPKEDSGSTPAMGPGQGTPTSLKRKSAGTMCITRFMKKRRREGQVGAGDMDGFQADTEEEEEEEGDCVSMDVLEAGEVAAHRGAPSEAGGLAAVDSGEGPLPASPLGPS